MAVTAMVCSLAIFSTVVEGDDLETKFIVAYLQGYFRVACLVGLAYVAELTAAIHDPPDANFTQVALPTPTAAPPAALRCPKQLTRRACGQLGTAVTRYQKALAATEAAANGLAISLNRFSGADAAGSTTGRLLQAAAAKAYSAELVAALPSQQLAARALASTLRATHTDLVLKASDRQTLIRKLSSPGGVPASMIAQLTRRGAVTSATELRKILTEALAGLPKTLSLAGALSATSSAAGFTQFYRTLESTKSRRSSAD
jgi:hypothetical protein